jgi:hypothetical protein
VLLLIVKTDNTGEKRRQYSDMETTKGTSEPSQAFTSGIPYPNRDLHYIILFSPVQ